MVKSMKIIFIVFITIALGSNYVNASCKLVSLLGQSCNSDPAKGPIRECSKKTPGLYCDTYWNQCLLAVGSACQYTNECDGFKECYNGVCSVPVFGTNFTQKCRAEPNGTVQSTCGAGLTCSPDNGRCLRAQCSNNGDCYTVTCNSGTCGLPLITYPPDTLAKVIGKCNTDPAKGALVGCLRVPGAYCDEYWGQCLKTPGSPCGSTDECDKFNECYNGVCMPPVFGTNFTQKCRSEPNGTVQSTCASGLTCSPDNGRCIRSPCTGNNDCYSVTCTGGVCGLPLIAYSTVANVSGTCNTDPAKGKIIGCLRFPGVYCDMYWGQCLKTVGSACNTTDECDKFNECYNGVCSPPVFGTNFTQKCRSEPNGTIESSCGAGLTCSPDNGRCLRSPCTNNADCYTTTCNAGTCGLPLVTYPTLAYPGEPCNTNSSAGPLVGCYRLPGAYCDSYWGLCAKIRGSPCTNTSNCDSFDECIGGVCSAPTLGTTLGSKCMTEPGGVQASCDATLSCNSYNGRCVKTSCSADKPDCYNIKCTAGACGAPYVA